MNAGYWVVDTSGSPKCGPFDEYDMAATEAARIGSRSYQYSSRDYYIRWGTKDEVSFK